MNAIKILISLLVVTMMVSCDDTDNTELFQTHSIFADSALERVIRQRLGMPDGDFSLGALQSIEYLAIEPMASPDSILPHPWITNLSGLQYLTNLRELDLWSGGVENLEPLSGLTNLEHLEIVDQEVIDLSPLHNCHELTYLDLTANGIENLIPLSGLTRLEYLDVRLNNIEQIDQVHLEHLNHLDLSYNRIASLSHINVFDSLLYFACTNNVLADLNGIERFTALREFNARDNQISDASAIQSLPEVDYLRLSGNHISDLSSIGTIAPFYDLLLNGNLITNIEPLMSNPGMYNGYVWLTGNPLDTVSQEIYIPELVERGVDVGW